MLCLFESSSRASVKETSERVGMPCERVIETVWIGPSFGEPHDAPGGSVVR